MMLLPVDSSTTVCGMIKKNLIGRLVLVKILFS